MQLIQAVIIALAGSAIAAPTPNQKRDLQVLQTAIQNIQGSLDKLDAAVKGVSNDAASAQPLLTAAGDVKTTINKATSDISASQPLQLQEAISLQQIASGLQTSTMNTIGDLVAKKSTFDQLGVSSVVLTNLKDEKQATSSLGSAIVSKIPQIGQGIAQQTVDKVTAVVDNAITTFSS